MKINNTYFTSYFPLISILFFSMAFAIHLDFQFIHILQQFGIYDGMLEFFSERGIFLTFFFLIMFLCFMMIAALKLIAETVFQLSILFFTTDDDGHLLKKMRIGSAIYLGSSVLALLSFKLIIVVIFLFAIANVIYFFFFLIQVNEQLSFIRQLGIVFFHFFFWCTFVLTISYAALKLYNSFVNSIPII